MLILVFFASWKIQENFVIQSTHALRPLLLSVPTFHAKVQCQAASKNCFDHPADPIHCRLHVAEQHHLSIAWHMICETLQRPCQQFAQTLASTLLRTHCSSSVWVNL